MRLAQKNVGNKKKKYQCLLFTVSCIQKSFETSNNTQLLFSKSLIKYIMNVKDLAGYTLLFISLDCGIIFFV